MYNRNQRGGFQQIKYRTHRIMYSISVNECFEDYQIKNCQNERLKNRKRRKGCKEFSKKIEDQEGGLVKVKLPM